MQKNTTLIKTVGITIENETYKTDLMQPKEETLQKILQFAASFRTEKLAPNRYVNIILN
ncbi:MAG: hypothetical protein LBH80_07350 [Prevotellaceae bacterium]|jgi:hypothetical protein|nr:hypothetical protein [Prevotellaceae bacterium]